MMRVLLLLRLSLLLRWLLSLQLFSSAACCFCSARVSASACASRVCILSLHCCMIVLTRNSVHPWHNRCARVDQRAAESAHCELAERISGRRRSEKIDQ